MKKLKMTTQKLTFSEGCEKGNITPIGNDIAFLYQTNSFLLKCDGG